MAVVCQDDLPRTASHERPVRKSRMNYRKPPLTARIARRGRGDGSLLARAPEGATIPAVGSSASYCPERVPGCSIVGNGHGRVPVVVFTRPSLAFSQGRRFESIGLRVAIPCPIDHCARPSSSHSELSSKNLLNYVFPLYRGPALASGPAPHPGVCPRDHTGETLSVSYGAILVDRQP